MIFSGNTMWAAVLLFCKFLAIVSSKVVDEVSDDRGSGSKATTLVDLIINNIQEEVWTENEDSCYVQILDTLRGANNLTLGATWLLDANQLPVGALYGSKYQLGNFDECLKAPWPRGRALLRPQYCLADVALSGSTPRRATGAPDPRGSVKTYVNTLTKYGRRLNVLTWGVCVPAACSPPSVSKYLRILLRISHLGKFAADPKVNLTSCHLDDNSYEYTTGFRLFLLLVLSLFMIAITSTSYTANRHSDSSIAEVAKAFCLKRNWNDLTQEIKGDISTLHGIRTLTAVLVAYSHQFYFVNSSAVGNGLDLDRDLDLAFMVLHTDLLTDTFLFMSGLLLVKGLLHKKNLENPLLVLFKRYVRLIGPIAMLVFYVTSVSIHAGSGPIWHRIAGMESKFCAANWWINILLLNNYVNTDEMCSVILWYVPADYHLTILGVAIIYLCRSRRRVGLIITATVATIAIVLPGIVTYRHQLPASIMYDPETLIDLRQNSCFKSTYTRSHLRAGSYLVGLAAGWIFSTYPTERYLKAMNKKWSVLTFCFAFGLGWTPMIIGGLLYTRPYDATEAAIFAATNRIVWAFAIAIVVIVCQYGELPLINSLLSWKPMAPLGRLSYGMYLVHPMIMQRNVYAARAPLRQDFFTMFTDSMGAIVLGYTTSLLIWLLVEAPVVNLLNLALNPRKSPLIKSNTDIREESGTTDIKKKTS